MEKEDFINALDAIGKIRDTILTFAAQEVSHSTECPNFSFSKAIAAYNALEDARHKLITLRDHLHLHPED